MAAAKLPRCRTAHVEIPGAGRTEAVWLCDDANEIRVGVVPADGGEIASIRLKRGTRWGEVLYCGMDYDPNPPVGWPGRAPLLWPAVGRSYARADIERAKKLGEKLGRTQWEHKGRIYPMPMHGFVRLMPWTLVDRGADANGAWCVCEIDDSEETREYYPFAFSLRATHRLAGGEIRSLYEVRAGDNDDPLPFNIGNHIGFRMPFFGKGDYMRCAIRSPGRHNVTGAGPSWRGGRRTAVNLTKAAPLGDGLYQDVFLMGYTRRKAWGEVRDPFSGIVARVSQAERPVRGKYLSKERDLAFVFWGRPQDGQICPEPWLGVPNSLNTGRHLLKLEPGGLFKWEMRVAFTRTGA